MPAAYDALDDPRLQAVLAREHALALGDEEKLARVRPQIEAAKKAGAGFETYGALYPNDAYLAIEPAMGRFLYLAACSIGARRMVEFGTSFGVSTLYLAAAARATGGRVIGSEREPGKVARARANLAEAGLDAFADILEGDAMQTLATVEGPVDLLFLDGWKELYVPVLQLMEGRLRPGALVLADNIHTFPDELQAYVDYVSRPEGPYRSTVLPFESGLGYALYCGP